MKFNWGTGIVIAMLLFMGFILSFVWKASFNPKYDHTLVSETYYEDDINYQKEIDAKNNAKALANQVKINQTDKGILFIFPAEFKTTISEGSIGLMRLANEKLDVNVPLKLDDANSQLISSDVLVQGRYQLKIFWIANAKSYMIREVLDIK
jgi:hypothetical protein